MTMLHYLCYRVHRTLLKISDALAVRPFMCVSHESSGLFLKNHRDRRRPHEGFYAKKVSECAREAMHWLRAWPACSCAAPVPGNLIIAPIGTKGSSARAPSSRTATQDHAVRRRPMEWLGSKNTERVACHCRPKHQTKAS